MEIDNNSRVDTAQILKGTALVSGDGFKDQTKIGDVVYVYALELPPPHAPGQYLRVGSTTWTAIKDKFYFVPATISEVWELFQEMAKTKADFNRIKEVALDYNHTLRSTYQVAERIAVQQGTVVAGTNFGGLHEAVKTTLEKHHGVMVPYMQEEVQKLLGE